MSPTGSDPSSGTLPPREAQCENSACGEWFRVPAKLIGHAVRCPHCGTEMRADGALERQELPALKRHCHLVIRSGPAFVDRDHDLDPQRSYTLGRADDCEILLPGSHVSRRHASLHWVNKHWVLEDLNSTHGTEVNGLRVNRHELADGDRVGIGEYKLAFGVPRKPLQPGRTLLDAGPAHADEQPLKVEIRPMQVDEKVKAAAHTILAAGASFETNKDVQRVYSQAAHDVRIRQVLWAGGALLVVGVVLWSLGVFSSAKPQPSRSAARPSSAPATTIPPAFQAAIREKRFADAAAEIESMRAAGNSADTARRMTDTYDKELTAWNATLLRRATTAAAEKDWKTVEATLATASDPVYARFSSGWTALRDQYESANLGSTLAKLRESGDFDRAFELIDQQRARIDASAELAQLEATIRADARCGLRVVTQPADAAARIVIDKSAPHPGGRTIWRLHPGRTEVYVTAPGFRALHTTIELEAGTVRQAELKLSRAAAGPLWAMSALRGARRPAALWAAARYYAQAPSSAVRYSRAELAALEQPARRGVESSPPRVANLALKDGGSLLGQIWNQPGFVSIRALPDGEKRTIKLEDVTRTEDVPAPRAARLLAEALFTEEQNEGGSAEALQAVAVLMLQYGDASPAASELMPYVRRCVEDLEKACAGCCGAGMAACPDCDARGSISGEVACPTCKGTRGMACVTCRGSGNEPCRSCGGSGETVVQVRSGAWVRDSYRKCTTCNGRGKQRCTDCPGGVGKIECRRCKGTGKISGKGECPTCTGERTVRCPACKGDKARDEMTPEARDAAEAEALATGERGGP